MSREGLGRIVQGEQNQGVRSPMLCIQNARRCEVSPHMEADGGRQEETECRRAWKYTSFDCRRLFPPRYQLSVPRAKAECTKAEVTGGGGTHWDKRLETGGEEARAARAKGDSAQAHFWLRCALVHDSCVCFGSCNVCSRGDRVYPSPPVPFSSPKVCLPVSCYLALICSLNDLYSSYRRGYVIFNLRLIFPLNSMSHVLPIFLQMTQMGPFWKPELCPAESIYHISLSVYLLMGVRTTL